MTGCAPSSPTPGRWASQRGDRRLRVTFAVGLATIEAARAAKREMCRRAAMVWGIDEEAVVWEDGAARPAGPNAGEHPR